MEAMRSAAHIKSGCALLSGAGNEASSAGWGALLEAITMAPLFLDWGFGLCAQFFSLAAFPVLEIRAGRTEGARSLWWSLASHPKLGANGQVQEAHEPDT